MSQTTVFALGYLIQGAVIMYLLYGNHMARKVCHTMHESMVAMLDRIKALEDQAYLRAPYKGPTVRSPRTISKLNPYDSLLKAELDLEDAQTPPEECT